MANKLIYAFLILSLLLTGCALNGATTEQQNTTSAAGPVVIGFGASESQRSIYEPLIKKFNTENPEVRVQFVALPPANGLVDDIMRGIVSSADTAVVDGIRNTDMINGNLTDLSPLMNADKLFDQNDFYPGLLEMFSRQGRTYLLPRSVMPAFVLYNKQLWIKSGLDDPKPDWTWRDLLSSAGQIARQGGDGTYGFLGSDQSFSALLMELNDLGIQPFSQPAEQLRLDRPEFAKAISRVLDLARARAIYAPQEQPTLEGVDNLIRDQRVGIWNSHSTTLDSSTIPFEFGVLPLPAAPLPFHDFVYVDGYIMSGGTQHPVESWRWLSFLSRQAFEVQSGMNPPSALIPARISVTERGANWKKIDPEIRAVTLAALNNVAKFVSIGDHDSNIYGALGLALNDVIHGTVTPEQSPARAQEYLSQRIAMNLKNSGSNSDKIIVATPIPMPVSSSTRVVRFNAGQFDQYLLHQSVDRFNSADTGVLVQLVDAPAENNQRQLSSLARSSDCFTWDGPPSDQDIAFLKDLQPYLDVGDIKSSEYPGGLLAYFHKSNSQYAIPHSFMLPVVNYNKTIFDGLHIDIQDTDWTPDDFLQVAEKITDESGKVKRYGFAEADRLSSFAIALDQFGVSLEKHVNNGVVVDLTSPKAKEAIDYYIKLLHFSPNAKGTQDTESRQMFMNGSVGSIFSYQLLSSDQAHDFAVAVAPLPKANTIPFVGDLHSIGFYVSASSQEPDACLSWFRHFSEDLSLLAGWFPARIPIAESEGFSKQTPAGTERVYKKYRALLDSNNVFQADNNSLLQDPISSYWIVHAIDQISQGRDIKAELEKAQAITQSYLECVQGRQEKLLCAQQVDPDFNR